MGVLGQVECHQPVQGIPLALVVLVKSPISWSQDNNIAVVTQHGTYIFDLHITSEECSPGLMFNRSFIAPPKEVHKVDTEVNVSSLIDHASRADVHNLILDETLSSMQRAKTEIDPKLSKNISPALPGGDPNHIGYRRGAWSPRGIGKYERCMICLVTHDHQVFLVARKNLFWKEIINISNIWNSYVTANKWSMLKMKWNTPAYEKHTSRIRMLAVAEILWTPLFDADSLCGFSVLIMSLANGRAVFWRVPANLDQQGPQFEKAIEIMSVEDFKLANISSMYWLQGEGHTGLLTVGNCHGQVKMFEVQFYKSKVSVKDYGFALEEEDNLNVNHIHLSNTEEEETDPHKGTLLMVVAKHNILLAMVIKITNDAISVQNTAFKHVSKLAITGIVYLNPVYVYISVKDGAVHHASVIIKDKDKMSIVVHEPVFQSEGSAYTGFMTSPNKTLWGILESISVAYDHLIVREPTQINFYQVGRPMTILSHLRSSPLPVYQNVDILESLRISLLKCEDVDLPLITVEDLKKLSTNQKKLEHWLQRMFRAVGFRKQEAKDLDVSENSICRNIIEDNAISILKEHAAARGKIPGEMFLSLSVMCMWFQQQKLYSALIKSILPKIEDSEKEKCLVCASTVELSSITMETCSKGHKMPRCPRTLLLTRPIVQCPRCRVFTSDQIKYSKSNMMPRCLFCDGFVLQLTKRRTEK